MRLATLRREGTTIAVRIDGDLAIPIPSAVDVGALLRQPDWRDRAATADGDRVPLAAVADESWAPVVMPGKIICVGLNYREHIVEMGRPLPEFPTLFAKFPEAVIGAHDPLRIPAVAPDMLDWEAELAVVVGSTVRNADVGDARAAIAGYTLINDVTARDYQYRTSEWFQGKTFEGTAPLGPVLVTADEFEPGTLLRCRIHSEIVQEHRTDDLVFGPAELVSYISEIVTLQPGDVIATGTPAGVGHARTPPRYLRPGDVLVTEADGIGVLRNPVVAA